MNTKLKLNHFQSLTKKHRNKGFTLTELLIVIVITGILPAVTIPFILNHYDLRTSDLPKHDLLKIDLSQD